MVVNRIASLSLFLIFCSVLQLSLAAPALDLARAQEMVFEVNGETHMVKKLDPAQFYNEIQTIGSNKAKGMAASEASFMYLATSTQRKAMNPAVFTNNFFTGYDARSGMPSLVSAFDDGSLAIQKESVTYGQKMFALAYSEETQSKMDKVSIGVEGGFTGGSANFGLESGSENSKNSKTVKIKVFLRSDTNTSSLPFGQKIALKKEAIELYQSNPQGFMDKYGTHAVSIKTYGCMSVLEGEYQFSSSSQKDNFGLSLGASGSSGAFSASVSIGIQNAASKADKDFKLTLSLTGDVTDIKPKDPASLESWATALQEQFDEKCQQYVANNKVTVKSIGAFPWSKIFSATSMPTFSIEDMANIGEGNRAKAIAIDGYNKLADYVSSLGQDFVSNRGSGGCYYNGKRDLLVGPVGHIGDLTDSFREVSELGWMTDKLKANFSSASSTDIKLAALTYRINANQEVVKFARKSNTMVQKFKVEFYDLADKYLNTIEFNALQRELKICVYGDVSFKPRTVSANEKCPESPNKNGIVEVGLNLDTASASAPVGILKANCQSRESSDPVATYFESYHRTNCVTANKFNGVKLEVKPVIGSADIVDGYVPCDFAI